MRKNGDNRVQFIIIMIIAFTIYMSNQMVGNTVTKYADSMYASTQLIGFIGGTFGITAMVTRPIVGQIVDRGNNKTLLAVCVAALIVSNSILVVATKPIELIISRAITGIAWSFGATVCFTTAANALPRDKLAGGIGIFTMSQTLAQVLGPSAAIWILGRYSFSKLYIVATAILVLSLFLVLFFQTKDTVTKSVKFKFTFRFKEVFAVKAALPTMMLMCNAMQTAAVSSFILIYADEKGIVGLGFFFTLQAMSIMVTRPFISKNINDENSYYFIIACEILIIMGLLNLYFAKNLTKFVIAAVFFGVGKSGSQPALQSMCLKAAKTNETGKASNTFYAGQDVGQFAGSYIAGIAAGLWGYKYAFASIAVIVTLGLIIFIVFDMLPKKKSSDI
jgi:predicted MFS family arabinose efflux permease